MTIRDERQLEFANKWISEGEWGILHLCPRFGKIRCSIHIINKIAPASILIAYPDGPTKDSWIKEFELLGIDYSNISFTTHRSIEKHIKEKYDLVIIDEIHLLSENQIIACSKLLENNRHVLGLTGTLTSREIITLRRALHLPVIATYTIEQAVKEGIISDYEIRIIEVPLDDKIVQSFSINKKSIIRRTEKKQFNTLSNIINDLEEKGRDTKFMRLARMRVVQKSISKLEKTKQLIEEFSNERILVFCGLIATSDTVGITSYHSKSNNKEEFEKFVTGETNHLAVVKLGNTGVTYKPLSRVIINYFDSDPDTFTQKVNRCMSLEYDNPDKKALIYIICTNEPVEKEWLKKALKFFDISKITWQQSN